jgi:hypothetical protein
MNIRHPAVALLIAAWVFGAHAQKVSPGLWEHSMTMKTQSGRAEASGARMQEEMARLPPEQRKMMEQMMARQGVSMGAGPGAPLTVRVCVTPEQAARGEFPQGEGRCKQDSLERSGKTMRFKFSCSGNPPSSGSGEYTLISDKAHKGHVVVETLRDGKPERVEMEQSGRWLAADCGEIKPRK